MLQIRPFLIGTLMIGAAIFLPGNASAEKNINAAAAAGNAVEKSAQQAMNANGGDKKPPAPANPITDKSNQQGNPANAASAKSNQQGNLANAAAKSDKQGNSANAAAKSDHQAMPANAAAGKSDNQNVPAVKGVIPASKQGIGSESAGHSGKQNASQGKSKQTGSQQSASGDQLPPDGHASQHKTEKTSGPPGQVKRTSLHDGKTEYKGNGHHLKNSEKLVQQYEGDSGETGDQIRPVVPIAPKEVPVGREEIPVVDQTGSSSQRLNHSGSGQTNDRIGQGNAFGSPLDKWFMWFKYNEMKLVQSYQSRYTVRNTQWENAPPSPPPQEALFLKTVTRS